MRQKALDEFPIEDVWGVGRQLAKKFARKGLRTAGDLARCDPFQLLRAATACLKRIFRPGYMYQKAGVMLLDIQSAKAVRSQKLLFDIPNKGPARERLMETIDRINASMSRNALFIGSEGVESSWTPRSEFRSPCYTTRWSDLLVAKAE